MVFFQGAFLFTKLAQQVVITMGNESDEFQEMDI
jgi:hypothetical protein